MDIVMQISLYPNLCAYAAKERWAKYNCVPRRLSLCAYVCVCVCVCVCVSIRRHGILDDMWAYEAEFLAARHTLLLTYFAAYRHATDLGIPDMFVGQNLPNQPKAFSGPNDRSAGGGEGVWDGASVNGVQPKLLGARQALRRELIDTCFRYGVLKHTHTHTHTYRHCSHTHADRR